MFHTRSNQSNDNILVCLPSIWTTASETGMKISVPDLNIYHVTFFIIPVQEAYYSWLKLEFSAGICSWLISNWIWIFYSQLIAVIAFGWRSHINHGTLCQRSRHQLCRLLLYPCLSAFVYMFIGTFVHTSVCFLFFCFFLSSLVWFFLWLPEEQLSLLFLLHCENGDFSILMKAIVYMFIDLGAAFCKDWGLHVSRWEGKKKEQEWSLLNGDEKGESMKSKKSFLVGFELVLDV